MLVLVYLFLFQRILLSCFAFSRVSHFLVVQQKAQNNYLTPRSRITTA